MHHRTLIRVALCAGIFAASAGVAFAQTTTPSTSCPQGWTWNGSNCQINQQSCTAAGGSWTNSSASCSFGSAAATPPPPVSGSSNPGTTGITCPAGQFPMNGGCVPAPSNSPSIPNAGVKPATTTGQAPPAAPPVQNPMPFLKALKSSATLLTKLGAKLTKSSLTLPADCTQALSEAQTLSAATSTDTGALRLDLQALTECRSIGNALLQAPGLMKRLTRAHDRLAKTLDDAATQDWTALTADYAAIKSGSFDETDVVSFYSDAQTFGDDINIDVGSVPQIQVGEQQSGANSGGASVWDAIASFLGF